MSQTVTIEPVAYPSDPRGLVIEPIGADDLPRQHNVHLVITVPGAIRGNHYHRRGSEITVVIGPALFRYREGSEVKEVHVPEGQAYRMAIPAGVPHAFQNTGQAPQVLIGFNTEIHDPAHPDVVREVLIEPAS